jgi:hypothetical protein
MSNPNAKPQRRQRREGAGYEKRDANAKWIFAIAAFVLVAGLMMHFVLARMTERLEKKSFPTDAWSGARHGRQIGAQNKTFPHLQLNPPEDLNRFRASEEAELNSYGWIDRTAGVVRIPVARAMELMLERGLPTRTGTNQAAMGPSSFELQQRRTNSNRLEIKEAR